MRSDVPGRLDGDVFAALEQLLETRGVSTGLAPSLSQTQRHAATGSDRKS
jgi:hypothetical protein